MIKFSLILKTSSLDFCKDENVAKNNGEHVFTDSKLKLENQKKSYGGMIRLILKI